MGEAIEEDIGMDAEAEAMGGAEIQAGVDVVVVEIWTETEAAALGNGTDIASPCCGVDAPDTKSGFEPASREDRGGEGDGEGV